jgi:thiamine biosynthesis lipoprotein
MLHSIKFRAMSCDVAVWLDCDSNSASPLKEVPGWLEGIEQNLSRFRPESEISRLNRRVNEWVEVSDLLLANIVAAKRGAHQTGGLFNPLILNDLLRIGYDRNIECISKSAPPVEARVSFIPGCDDILVDVLRSRVRIPAPIDLGGIAKGWTAAQVCRRLSRIGPCLSSIGGDIAVHGAPRGQAGWPIRIGHWKQPDKTPLYIGLCSGAVATSGVMRRCWERGGLSFHHIIDPRSGNAAATDVVAATVIHQDASVAECWAKAAVLLGSVDGLRWIDEHETGAALVIRENGDTLWSQRFCSYLIPPRGRVIADDG